MSKLSRFVLLPAVLCGVAFGPLSGCGSSTGPSAVPCTQATVFSSRIFVPANSKDVEVFSTTSTGRLQVVIDWGSDVNVVSVVLAQAPCDLEHLQNSQCNVFFTLFSPPKPLADATTLVRAGSYSLILANPNPLDETFAAHVLLSSAGCEPPAEARLAEPAGAPVLVSARPSTS